MPLLQVRDIPDHVYRLLVEQAAKERRSLAQQAVAVLARGLEVELDSSTASKGAARN
jgi:plasmid stability protein